VIGYTPYLTYYYPGKAMRNHPVAMPLRNPAPINCERWQNFAARRKMLDEIRENLENMEREWAEERDQLVAMLVDGAEIERDG
jgi:hypothetical protein